MALSNPERIVNVQELDYFRQKADAKYATKGSVYTLASEADVRAIVGDSIISI